jgi:hypothetical protein
MKTKIAAVLLAVTALFTTACEQHKWSDTKSLFEHESKPEAHGDEHGKTDEHAAKPAEHGAAKPAAPEKKAEH